MRVVSFTLVAAMLAVGVLSHTDYVAQFEKFKTSYNRKYLSEADEAKRLGLFIHNMQRAEALAKRNPQATFGMNEFSDISPKEFKRRHNSEGFYRRKASKPLHVVEPKEAATVSSIDWRQKGAVTAVKNQGDCGSCWSFSTTGNIEGQWQIAGNTLVSVSEQELVSCDTTCSGCNGGLMDDAFEWLVNSENGGITSEAQYPYVSGTGTVPACSMSGMTSVAFISGHQDVAHSESAMSTFLAANGPVSIGVDASSWQTYSGGILTDCTSNQVDHGVLAVGFDLSASTPYWIIKNSWGASWGEAGYIRVAYGSNQCLITTAPSSSTVSKGPRPPTPPSPPSPPSPPNPNPPSPPAPSTGSFTQYTCSVFTCTSGCTSNSFSTGVCLQLSGGGSAVATCGSSNLYLQAYTSSDCSGAATSSSMPLDQCLQDNSGSYMYNTCGSSSGSGSSSSGGAVAQNQAKVILSK